MRKSLLSGLFIFLLVFFGNVINVSAQDYYWDSRNIEVDGEIIKEVSWFAGARALSADAEKLEGMPELKDWDIVYIYCEPNEEVRELLKTIDCKLMEVWIDVQDVEIQIGSPEHPCTAQYFSGWNGKIIHYGDVSFLRGGWYDNTSVTVNGNVAELWLGDVNNSVHTGSFKVTGDVNVIKWYPENDNENYAGGFSGNVIVEGTVAEGDIFDFKYDEVIGVDTWQVVQKIAACEEGVFQMTEGVLANDVVVNEAPDQQIIYDIQYQCYMWGWSELIQNAETRDTIVFRDCEIADIPAKGAKVTVYSTPEGETVSLTADLQELYIYPNEGSACPASFTLNGDVELMRVGTGYQKSTASVVVNGDVKTLDVDYIYRPNNNLTITGTVESGRAKNKEEYTYFGYFDCSNMEIIKNGNWNTNLYMRDSRGSTDDVSYTMAQKEEVNDALATHGVGTEFDVNGATIFKDTKVEIAPTGDGAVAQLSATNSIKDILGQIDDRWADNTHGAVSETIGGIDIDVSTFFRNANTDDIFSVGEYHTENIKNLDEGKTIGFSVKIPESLYDENAKYSIVRHHVNADGTVVDEVIGMTQNKDIMSFESDKFSSFLIVKTVLEEKTTELAITRQPEPVLVKEGENAGFSLVAEGENVIYQWYYKRADQNAFELWPGKTKSYLSLTAKAAFNEMLVYCVVTDSNGESVTSDIVALNVEFDVITKQPSNVSVPEGQTANFAVVATGNALSYQWYYKRADQANFELWPGKTKSYLGVTAKAGFNGMQVYCVVTDGIGATYTSSVATLTVESNLVISQQPVNVTVREGETANFVMKAEGTNVTYQWYYKRADMNEFAVWPGKTKPYMSCAGYASFNNMQVYCIVTDASGNTINSNTITLTVESALSISQQPVNVTVNEGETANFLVKTVGANATYQWYYKRADMSEFAVWPGKTKSYMSCAGNVGFDGMQVYCLVSDGSGNSVQSNIVTLEVAPTLAITKQPTSVTVQAGEEAVFSVVTVGSNVNYQWYYKRADMSEFAVWPGKTKSYMSCIGNVGFDQMEVYCMVSNTAGQQIVSDHVVLSVNQ